MRTTKRVTVPALIVWTAMIGCVVALHFAAARLPVLGQRPFTDIVVLATLAGTAYARSLMRPAAMRDVLPSRANSPFVNVVYAANLIIGLLGILSLLYLLGFLGPEKPRVIALALGDLVAMVLVQIMVIAIPTKSPNS